MAGSSVESVADVHHRVGARGDVEAAPDVLIEVPHAADRRAHYDALAERLIGPFPERLHEFFHVNTDVGAWPIARAIAERWVDVRPTSHVLLIECLIPRTFVDCNRRLDFADDDLAKAGLTEAVPAYVRHDDDRQLLAQLHQAYVELADAAYDAVCGAGGLALNPHTYGPRSLPIESVDDTIVRELRRVHEPEILARSPLRPHVDVIGRDAEGRSYAPEGMTEAITEALRPLGLQVADSQTYVLHPVTQGFRYATRHPGQVFGFEVRRDLVCAWSPFAEQEHDETRTSALARALVQGIDQAWD